MPWPAVTAALAAQQSTTRARKKRTREVEDAEYVKMVRRMMAALERRGGADVETLSEIAAIANLADEILTAAIIRCHDTGTDGQGYSYTEIADRLGVSRQAVRQRVTRQRGIVTVPDPRPAAI